MAYKHKIPRSTSMSTVTTRLSDMTPLLKNKYQCVLYVRRLRISYLFYCVKALQFQNVRVHDLCFVGSIKLFRVYLTQVENVKDIMKLLNSSYWVRQKIS